jgi:glycosyltransferase involved in cell wall biosynthesis
MALLSIIVPVYNSEKYVDSAIRSVVNQTFTDWELVLINDGSTDSSLAICENYQKSDNRITVYSQLNKGLGAALNYGIGYTTGDYVMFLDSDDTLALDTLEKNAVLLQEHDCDFVQFPVYMNYSTSSSYIIAFEPQLYTDYELFFNLWLGDNSVISWIKCNKIIKNSVLKKLSFQENMVYEDNYFIVDLLKVVKSFYISNEGLYHYYLRDGSISNSVLSEKKELDTLKVLDHILENLNSVKQDKLYLKYLLRVINVEKSLVCNFKIASLIRYKFLKRISTLTIVISSLTIKDKIKLLASKFKLA